MVKHLSCLMTRFFTRERFGRPQFLAGVLLLFFLAQACWLVHSELSASPAPGASEQARIAAGWRQLHGGSIAGAPYPDPPSSLPTEISADINNDDGFDSEHSPLLSLLSAAPLLASPQPPFNPESSPRWRWLPRLPFLACGVFLGASLWYVARRLCGNTGGFLALALYCFSPTIIQASAVWHTEPEIFAAWGSFGAIFTAIAVAHTLYAPREVILWNWRRIVLLGVSLAIAVGSQFSMIVVVPLALVFMLYLAPIRRGAALIIWIAAPAPGAHLALRHLFLPSPSLFRKHAARLLLGSDLAQLHRPRRLHPSHPRDHARLSRPRTAPTGRDHHLYPLAPYPLLRQHRPRPDSPPLHRTRHGPSPRSRRRISTGLHPFHPDLRLRRSSRPDGNSAPPPSHGLNLGTHGRLHPLESPSHNPSPNRIKLVSSKAPRHRPDTSVTHPRLKIVAKLIANSPAETYPCDSHSMSI